MMMEPHSWIRSFPAAITVCDSKGTILEMNEKAIELFHDDGGTELIGKNMLECHPEPVRTKVKELLATHKANYYTIEKYGVKKLIYQVPWFDNQNMFAGIVELSLPIPFEMPHFVRK